jgi:hypothetical protein
VANIKNYQPVKYFDRTIYVQVEEEDKPSYGIQDYMEAFSTIIKGGCVGLCKAFSFFADEYPKALEDVRREDRAKAERARRENISSLPRGSTV